MRIAVIGGGGGLGGYIVGQALERGHEVTAFSRNPRRLGIEHHNLRYVAGDVLKPESAAAAVRGAEAILITLGLPTRQAMGFGRSRVLSAGTQNVVEAAKAAGIKRIILETAIGSGETSGQLGPLNRFSLRGVLSWLFKEKDKQERAVRQSGLHFVIVRPGALTNGKRGRRYESLERVSVWKAGIFTQISRADVADFMLDQLESDANLGKALVVSYPRNALLDFPRWIINYK